MNDLIRISRHALLAVAAAAAVATAAPTLAQSLGNRPGDYIVAVVNEDLVTAGEVEMRLSRVRAQAERSGSRLPPEETLRRQVADALIEERVVTTYARSSGVRVEMEASAAGGRHSQSGFTSPA